MIFDLHVHTRFSECSRLSIDDILENAARLGLDGICITDHHSMEALEQIDPGLQPNGLRVFVGQEYHTTDGDFLVFGPTTPLPGDLSAKRLMTRVKELGGVAVAAHPFRSGRSVSEFIIKEGLCRIVESFNGRDNEVANQGIASWRQTYDLIECAGSDAHSLEELGTAKTRFHVPINTSMDLVNALNQGLCSPCSNGHSPGSG